jgi:phosphoserine phosphatase
LSAQTSADLASRLRHLAFQSAGDSSELDVIVQAASGRQKRLLVADMDSTMITVECIDELADYAGLKAEVAAITERAMQGELDFEAALEARVRLLKGMPAETIDRCREERVRITPGAKALVRTMKARGATCILVSGGFTRFAEPVAAEIGFDRVVANVLEIEDGRLTGEVRRPIVGAQTKRQVLLDAATELGIPIEATMAVGDGANDIPMLEAAGLGVAFHAKPAARAAADAVIDCGDLGVLLYAQGIARAEWVAA